MADELSVNLEGLPEVLGKMRELSRDSKLKGGRFALRKAANLVRDAAEAGARKVDDPESPESIADNLAVRFSSRTFRRTGNVMFRVGVMGGAGGSAPSSAFSGLPGGDTRHWRFVEFGSQHNIPAQPFMRRALSENIQNATNEFVREYGKAVDRAIRRARKAQGVT